jgi:AAA15 family ATPase/GTPase
VFLQFSVSNFRSLRDLQTLNLGASNHDKSLPENTLSPELPGLKGKRWLKAIALYGANASGKSTLIEAMEALSDWVGQSAKTTDPDEHISFIDPFALDAASAEIPTAFAVTFAVDGVRFEYRVAATKRLILHESLRAWPSSREQIWFERDWNPLTKSHDFSPDNPTGLPRNRDIEQRTLKNMLYLSKAVAENRKEVEAPFRWLVSCFRFMDLSKRAGLGGGFTLNQIDGKGDTLKSKIMEVLKHADLGVVDAATIEKEPPSTETMKMLQMLAPDLVKDLDKSGSKRPRFMEPQLFHQGPGNSVTPLEWERESAGTQRFFALIGPWLDFLEKGYTICIDEIETSMHPIMVRELLKLIFNETTNTGGAQVIFTTHNPLFLDSTLLRRDQVWFTDKDDEGISHLYPLTEYQPRQEESLIRGYMAGRYGAVPFVPRGLLATTAMSETITSDKEGQDG